MTNPANDPQSAVRQSAPATSSSQPIPPVRFLPLPAWVREHVGLLTTSLLFSLLVFRIVAFAGFNPTTAKAIVQAGGASDIALASALASFDVVATVIGSFITVNLAMALWRRRWNGALSWTAFLYVGWIGVYVLPFAALGTYGLVLVLAWALGFIKHPNKGLPWTFDWDWLIVSIVIPQVFISAQFSWLPTEAIERPGQDVFKGYVVGERQDDLLILDDRKKLIFAYPASTLKRSYCLDSSERWWWGTLMHDSKSGYPACPT